MCLTDTSSEVDIHINDYLVTSEFARFADSAAKVPRQDVKQVSRQSKLLTGTKIVYTKHTYIFR